MQRLQCFSDEFYWHDKLPAEVRLGKIVTGTWSERLTYSVEYKTNKKSGWKVLEKNLFQQDQPLLDCSPEALDLAANEYVTEIRFDFGDGRPRLL